jgi:hypothetical protein
MVVRHRKHVASDKGFDMRTGIYLLGFLLLSACAAVLPDQGPTVAETQGTGEAASETVVADGETTTVPASGAAIVRDDNPNISDAQNFIALSEAVTLEQDLARIRAQREKFVIVAPTALPKRKNTVSVVAYALQSKNAVGEQLYRRTNPLAESLAKRACQRYRLPDDAQEAFLQSGGPERDSRNLDPDGDGFACGWNPDTYRKMVQ